MTDVLLVDWLGRGGIAQTSEAFRQAFAESGASITSISRPSDALEVDIEVSKRWPGIVGAADVHARLVRQVQREIRAARPQLVYLQNYWIPAIEIAAVRTARSVGARVALAIHNDRPHERGAGMGSGLGRLARSADEVIVHSGFVASRVAQRFGLEALQIPHPVQVGLLATTPTPISEIAETDDDRPIAVAFGVLGRKYKGSSLIAGVAERLVDSWQVIAAGVGASEAGGPGPRVDRFLTEAELHWLVSRASITLLPYVRATQSGAVVLSQVLGSVPIASDVGGLRQQMDDGLAGVVVARNASEAQWCDAVRDLQQDPDRLASLRSSGRETAMRRHRRAMQMLASLLS